MFDFLKEKPKRRGLTHTKRCYVWQDLDDFEYKYEEVEILEEVNTLFKIKDMFGKIYWIEKTKVKEI